MTLKEPGRVGTQGPGGIKGEELGWGRLAAQMSLWWQLVGGAPPEGF